MGLVGPHQRRNAALALAALELLKESDFHFSEADLRDGLKSVSWPGRGEVFPGPPPLMLDGAHNPAAALALAETLSGLDYNRIHLVLGIMDDKDIPRIMAPLLPHAQALYLTRPKYFRAADTAALASAAAGFPGPATRYPDVPAGIEAARAEAGPDDLILVTGSLFTVGEARSYLTGVPQD